MGDEYQYTSEATQTPDITSQQPLGSDTSPGAGATGDQSCIPSQAGSPAASPTPAQSPGVSGIARPLTPQQQMMANKLGLNPNQPTDMFGNPIYNSVVGPYGAVQNPGMKQGSSDTGGVGDYLKSAGETLSGALQKVGDNLSSYYQNVGYDASRVLQHNVYGNLTPEQHAEAIKYPWRPVGEVADGFFAMPPDKPEDYTSKPLLWRAGRQAGKNFGFWDSGRQYGQLATDIQRRDMRGETVSERERAQANQYRDEFLVDAAKTAISLGTAGGVYTKLKP